MKINLTYLFFLFTSVSISLETDENVVDYPDDYDAGFERDVQPTLPPILVSHPHNESVHPINLVYQKPIFAEAVLRGPAGIRGLLYFHNSWNGVGIYGIVCGLRPGNHGFHIHQYGSINSGCEGAGPHFSIYRWLHGGPTDRFRHNGDLGNLQADPRGIAYVNQFNGQISLLPTNTSVLGRAILVHEWPDDLGVGKKESNVTGNVGHAIACGLIGLRPDKPPFPSGCPPHNF